LGLEGLYLDCARSLPACIRVSRAKRSPDIASPLMLESAGRRLDLWGKGRKHLSSRYAKKSLIMNRIATASDLLKFPLLRLDDWKTWMRWFEAAGVADPVAHGPVLNSASMLIDAAVDGQGVALARTALAAWDIINGRLLRPFDVSLTMSNAYWIVCPKVTSNLPKIATFRHWLLSEAADDARRLKTLAS
jgi:hypothetical protein